MRLLLALLVAVVAFGALATEASASLPALPAEHQVGALAGGALAGDVGLGVELAALDALELEAQRVRQDLADALLASELAPPDGFSLAPPPRLARLGTLLDPIAHPVEPLRFADLAPGDLPSLSKTRVWASSQNWPVLATCENRVSREDASGYELGLARKCVGRITTNLYAYVAWSPQAAVDPLGEQLFCLQYPMFCAGAGKALWDMGEAIVTAPARLMEADLQQRIERYKAYDRGGYAEYQKVARQQSQELSESVKEAAVDAIPFVGSGRALGEAVEACMNGSQFECGYKTAPAGVRLTGDVALVGGVASKTLGAAGRGAELTGVVVDAALARRIPGSPGVVTGGSSTTLGRNMIEEMGLPRSTTWPGYQAQHIMPIEASSHPVIQKIGMNLDDASNGLFLPEPSGRVSGLSRHRGYHSSYNEAVLAKLDELDVSLPVAELEPRVFALQQQLKQLQQSGLPLYPSQGATKELWLKALDKKGAE